MTSPGIHSIGYSGKSPAFRPPCWTGEPRPEGAITVKLESLTPDPNSSGAYASTLAGVGLYSHRDLPWDKSGRLDGFHLVQSVPVSTVRRTKQGFFSRASVEQAVTKLRTDFGMKAAVMEVVFDRQSPTRVAGLYGVKVGVLKVYATRVRQRIRGHQTGTKNMQKAKKNEDSEGELLTICSVMGGQILTTRSWI